jgi:hypothetical protein
MAGANDFSIAFNSDRIFSFMSEESSGGEENNIISHRQKREMKALLREERETIL